ncbi:MAG: hypothetical protein ACRCYO_13395 [Bacteroidia bacterium]
MEITIEDIVFTNPTFDVQYTIDMQTTNQFSPMVIITDSINTKVKKGFLLPPQPYINGSWNDFDVQNSVNVFFNL